MDLLVKEPHRAAEHATDRGAAQLGTSIKMPTVAAIVCNFNQKAYLEAAITSVAQQTYPHLECVVVDDCSTDSSGELIARILAGQTTKQFRRIAAKWPPC